MRIGLLVVLLIACGDEPDPLLVELDTGVIRGVEQGETRAFFGVPYAAPPVGDLRWRPPQRPEAWDGVRDAFQIGSQCPQTFSLAGPGGEEDCLFVNVWTPASAGAARSEPAQLPPVMVWLHGGAFVFGSGGDDFYSGRHLAETYGVVVVTVNYRLGALGFLAHPALREEDPAYPSSGNYGLEDQLAALEWVQRNIRAFGGDPTRVLLFGESAGGFSGCAHYVSPRSAGLFHAVISESGPCASSVPEPSRAEAEAGGIEVAMALGCPTTGAAAVACLRGKSADELLAATEIPATADQPPGGPFYLGGALLASIPSVDGFVLTTTLREAYAAGGFEPRPILLGTNRDEGTLFHTSFFSKEIATEAEYRDAIGRRFGTANVDAVLARYPVASFASANRALAEVTGDAFFVCPTRRVARGAAAAGAPVYLYSFEREPEQAFLADLGVFHSSEIPFVFGTDPAFPLARVGAGGQPVADTLQRYWTRFAATADPNEAGSGQVAWPRFELATERHLAIDLTSSEGTSHKAAVCDFWDALPPP